MPQFTATDARKIFDAAATREGISADQRAKIELMREYFCNPEFRAAMHDEVARINGVSSR